MSVAMHASSSVLESSAAVPTELIWRLSVDQYHAMIYAGILTKDDPVELLEGWLISKMAKNPPHTVVTLLIRRAWERLVPAGWYVNTQEPITTADSEPEPDVVVIRGEPRHYLQHHPGPLDVALVVEVADTTLQRDRGFKKRLYARAGIPVYWVVNLPESRFEVYTDPSGPTDAPDYRQRQDYGPADAIPFVLERTEVGRIVVQELLP